MESRPRFWILCVIALSTFELSPASCNETESFDICITAWPPTVVQTLPSGKRWLDVIVDDYGATAVYLDIPWSFLETLPGKSVFGPKEYGGIPIDIDRSITAVLQKGLNLYVRIYYGSVPGDGILGHPSLPSGFRLDVSDTTSDFFRHKLGIARKNGANGPKLVSFHSGRSVARLLSAHQAVVTHVRELADSLGQLHLLKEINPGLTWDAETEYPWEYFVDYSDSAQARFRRFLQRKYSLDASTAGFSRLLAAWGKPVTARVPHDVFQIDLREYNWSDATSSQGVVDPTGHAGFLTRNYSEFDFPGGRDDWMEFRTQELASIIEQFAAINHAQGIRCCIQIGSPFDHLIEKRGWHDITPLLEHVDGIRTANIVKRKATFTFEADLLRSVCTFWTAQNGRAYTFSTETNWPEYEGFPTDFLVNTWADQLITFFESGSAAHFLAGWGSWGEDKRGRRKEHYVEIFKDEYAEWRETLKNFSKRELVVVPPSAAIYFSTRQGRYTHGYSRDALPFTGNSEYYMRAVDKTRGRNAYDEAERKDIITTYMLSRDPKYLLQYPLDKRPDKITDDIQFPNED